MKNEIICNNCGNANAFYKLNCDKCKSYLRSRVVNIDLWMTIYLLFVSPSKAFRNIIHAEHKNFIIFLSLFIGLKVFLFSVMVNSFISPDHQIAEYFLLDLLLFISYTLVLMILLSFIIARVNSLVGLKNRFKDNYAAYIYSLIPLVITLFIMSPINYAIFGKYWFLYNPSPFLIRPSVAWIIAGVEGLFLLWSIFLSITATYVQSRNKIYSVIISILFWCCLISLMFFAPFLPF